MRFEFEDEELQRVYEDPPTGFARLGKDLVKAFCKKVNIISAASSEPDFRAMRSLHFEKLSGDRSGQHSIRLNDQWRLILRLVTDGDGRLVVIVEITDYH